MSTNHSSTATPAATPPWTTIGFTGHRSLSNERVVAAGIARALDLVAGKHPFVTAVSSAASGADTLFLEEVMRRGWPAFVVLPAPVEQFREDFPDTDWRRAENLLGKTVDVEVVERTDSAEEAYLEAGVLTMDRADVVVAVWNGRPAAGKGGTGDAVAYARASGKPLIVVDPDTGAVTAGGFDETGSPAPPPDARILEMTPRQRVERQFEQLEKEAGRHAPQARLLLFQIILLHLLATGIAVTSVTLKWTGALGYGATALKLTALLCSLLLVARHHRSHHSWLSSRCGAELCRSFLALWKLRRSPLVDPRVSMPGWEQLHRTLRIEWYLDKGEAGGLDTAKARYLEDRVENQIKYYRDGHAKAERMQRILRGAAVLATALAILSAATALVLGILKVSPGAYASLKTLSILLPLANAAMLSLVVAQDYGRRVIRYLEMVAYLETAAGRVRAAPNWFGLWRAVQDTESALLHEVTEWQTLSRFSGEAH